MTLTKEYIEEHMGGVHTYESFGRSIIELVLSGAAKELKENPKVGDSGKVTLSSEIIVAPFTTKGCVYVKVCVPLAGCTKIHVGVE